jgi:hypothetical protein
MDIPFQGQVTKDELTRIYLLDFKKYHYLIYVFGPFILLFIMDFIVNFSKGFFDSFLLIMILISGFMICYLWWAPLIGAWRTYRRRPEIHGIIAGAINDEEVFIRTTNSTGNLKWAVYERFARNNDTVLLYYKNTRLFNFFPRSFFSSDENWQAFHRLLDGKVQKGELKNLKQRGLILSGKNKPHWIDIFLNVVIGLPLLILFCAMLISIIYRIGH